ncbi:MAG: hypothetical protein RL199_1236 [Pseudomonadota bacterium]|jgi:hypothetical protein
MIRRMTIWAALAAVNLGPLAAVSEETSTRGATAAGSSEVSSEAKRSEGAPAVEQVRKILAKYEREPTVRDVQEAAGRYAEVHPEIITSWRSRARRAAMAPQLRAEYRTVKGDDTRQVEAGGSGSNSITTNATLEHRPLVRAQWDLDRLVFNPDELRVANQTVDLVRLRESVMDQVTKLYFERRRLQVENDLAPATDIPGRVRKELRLQELVADIDALTGGFFSQELDGRGRGR